MEFFDRQHIARRNTTRLIIFITISALIFYLPLVSLISFVYIFLFHTYLGLSFLSGVCLFIFLIICAIWLTRGSGNVFGGAFMSLGIGGRFLQPATVDYKEKQLLNIVEEMSIASSIVTPFIFILDKEKCINSMIFGETKDDAVLVITGGFLAHLSRDEMQGVVAHEFSHIFNFDLKMNKRVLVLSGLFPSIFAALIRSSISREREYLADASAVQYTRNPLGLAGALKKIRALSYGAWVQSLGVKPEKYNTGGAALYGAAVKLDAVFPM